MAMKSQTKETKPHLSVQRKALPQGPGPRDFRLLPGDFFLEPRGFRAAPERDTDADFGRAADADFGHDAAGRGVFDGLGFFGFWSLLAIIRLGARSRYWGATKALA
jgi:hypothetical protein